MFRSSPWAKGSKRIMLIRPASESATRGSAIKPANPDGRNRPGRESASTTVLIASTSTGTRWISSMMARSRFQTNPTGSAGANSRTAASSSDTNGISVPSIYRAIVVLPGCRGPQSSTTPATVRASRIRLSMKRGYVSHSRIADRWNDFIRPIESQCATS